jgi:hypothetical protein
VLGMDKNNKFLNSTSFSNSSFQVNPPTLPSTMEGEEGTSTIYSAFSFDRECHKLRRARHLFLENRDFTNENLSFLIKEHEKWKNQPLYLIYRDNDTMTHYFYMAAKRGNSIYRKRVMQRLSNGASFLQNPALRGYLPSAHNNKSNFLFVTLTWNPKVFLGSRKRAWMHINYYYNKFISNLRKKLGKVWVLRALESTEKGYPHLHLLIFAEKSFLCFKDKEGNYRLKGKRELERFWHSFVDVKMPKTPSELGSYITKDMTKSLKANTEKAKTTNALCWVFRKQSFAISNGKCNDLIALCTIQTQKEEIESEFYEKNITFIGLAAIKPFSDTPPPENFVCLLDDWKKYDLEESLMKRVNKKLPFVFSVKEPLSIMILSDTIQDKRVNAIFDSYNPESTEIIAGVHLLNGRMRQRQIDFEKYINRSIS